MKNSYYKYRSFGTNHYLEYFFHIPLLARAYLSYMMIRQIVSYLISALTALYAISADSALGGISISIYKVNTNSYKHH